MQPTSLTPNPKLFQQNRAKIINRNSKPMSRKGVNFAGLGNYIISELDSGSDELQQNAEAMAENFMSDASSFSNKTSSDDD